MPKCVSSLLYRDIALALLAFLLVPLCPLFGEKAIVVVTTSYNNIEWVERNVESILQQDYTNYRVVYVDDASRDGTADAVEEIVRRHSKKLDFHLIRNAQRIGALANIYSAIHEHCRDEEIVLSLDGDDWFYDDQVLKKIDAIYSSDEVWLTHGTLIEYPHYRLGWSIPVPDEIIKANAFRTYRCPSHLRTFYAWLFKKIKTEDLLYEGQFFKMTWDQAMMFPMCEMAGERQRFISDITYVYNIANPINDNKVDPQLQNDLEALIRSMPPYERLEKGPS